MSNDIGSVPDQQSEANKNTLQLLINSTVSHGKKELQKY